MFSWLLVKTGMDCNQHRLISSLPSLGFRILDHFKEDCKSWCFCFYLLIRKIAIAGKGYWSSMLLKKFFLPVSFIIFSLSQDKTRKDEMLLCHCWPCWDCPERVCPGYKKNLFSPRRVSLDTDSKVDGVFICWNVARFIIINSKP